MQGLVAKRVDAVVQNKREFVQEHNMRQSVAMNNDFFCKSPGFSNMQPPGVNVTLVDADGEGSSPMSRSHTHFSAFASSWKNSREMVFGS